MVAALGEVEYADIEIELFQVEIDGGIFGLVDVSQPEAGPEFAERVQLWPTGLLFHPPWDGEYDT
jgi:formate hydrogenlyase regulatory protein HycA